MIVRLKEGAAQYAAFAVLSRWSAAVQHEQHECAIVRADDAVRGRQIDAVTTPAGVIDEPRGPAEPFAAENAIAFSVQAGFLRAVGHDVLEWSFVKRISSIREIHVTQMLEAHTPKSMVQGGLR